MTVETDNKKCDGFFKRLHFDTSFFGYNEDELVITQFNKKDLQDMGLFFLRLAEKYDSISEEVKKLCEEK